MRLSNFLFGMLLFSAGTFITHAETWNQTSRDVDPRLEEHFKKPPEEARPWVFWMWLRVDSTPEAITRDLVEMKAKGIAGAILYDTGNTVLIRKESKMVLDGKGYRSVPTEDYCEGYHTSLPYAPISPWGDRTRELFRHASKEAGRIGLKLCISIGLAGTSGPIDEEYGQQKLVWSETDIDGPMKFNAILPVPTGNVPHLISQSPQEPALPTAETTRNFNGRQVAVLAVPHKEIINLNEVIDISERCDATGNLVWDVPEGQWQILRFAYVPTGKGNVWGKYTDALSREAAEKTWDSTIGKLLAEMSPEERKGLYAVEEDSWESGETTWTKFFPSEFSKLRGYDLIPLLPAIIGKTVKNQETTHNIRRDYYRTIADLIASNHYGHFRTLAERNELVFFAEPAGPNTQQLDTMLNCSAVDLAMGEYWIPSPHRPSPDRRFLLRNVASANHIYGKKITPCEGFTGLGPHWEETFFGMKNSADQAFADGCNLQIFHCFSHSPSALAIPGYVYFAGTHYTRQNTWWEQTPAFNEYLARCSYLLQQGLFVADALYYRGEGIGTGEPMKTQPALPAEGYDHDNCNLDVLSNRLKAENGRLILPDGMSYNMLVIPKGVVLHSSAKAKINVLVQNGAIVVGEDFLEDSPESVLKSHNIPPDFEWSGLSDGGEIDWIHRSAKDTDIYFIASRWDPVEKLECTFRISGKQPEIWNPVTGEIRDAVAFRQINGRTIVPLEFAPRESVFIVFRKPISTSASGKAYSNYPTIKPLQEISGSWDVSFDPKLRGPENSVAFETLEDWVKRPEEGIRHYSGPAVYRKTFDVLYEASGSDIFYLNLGDLHEVASVRLNGVDLGVLWTKPARVDVTSAIHQGKNELEITIVNLWPNRLIADESLSPEERLTETNIHKFTKVTPLYPSGLLGPVVLETVKR